MPAEISPALTWGPIDGPGVDHELPWSVHLTCKSSINLWQNWVLHYAIYVSIVERLPTDDKLAHRCRFRVWGRDGNMNLRDTMTFYQLWTAGVMLAAMCARSGNTGVFEHMGE